MPFERYLQPQPQAQPQASSSSSASGYAPYPADAALGVDAQTFSNNVQFQMPRLMSAMPTLAPGGGAEVLPPGLLPGSSGSITSWFSATGAFRADDEFSSTSASFYPQYQQMTSPAHSIPSGMSSYVSSHGHPDSPVAQMASSSSVPYAFPVQASVQSPHIISPMTRPQDAQDVDGEEVSPPPPQLAIPSALGLPVYSASGFDLLSVLALVANRPHPKITLGPVDMTCSFVVVDVRRYDSPIIYASPQFFALTGYSEREVMGRNCRFLQSPDGRLTRGEQRRYTSLDAVAHMKRSLLAHKECQASILNYRKGGHAFINLVTVIPVPASPDEEEIAYYVGFQVDLGEQPNAILERLRDGSYMVDYSKQGRGSLPGAETRQRDWRTNSQSMSGVSPELRTLLQDPAFVASIPITGPFASQCPTPGMPAAAEKPDAYDGNRPLHMMLLEAAPDFVHVVSLKGAFQYVAPAVRRVLGYEPAELVGRNIADFAHPHDVIPLTRELKDSSITPGGAAEGAQAAPRAVDLLFRMQAKGGRYVWLECRGRLHAEPGKSRKAIILSGRVRSMPRLDWGPVERVGGLVPPALASTPAQTASDGSQTPTPTPTLSSAAGTATPEAEREVEREFWGLLSAQGTFLFASTGVRDVLGWGAGEVIGRGMRDMLGAGAADVERALAAGRGEGVGCEMRRKDGGMVGVCVVLFAAAESVDVLAPYEDDEEDREDDSVHVPPPPIVCQVRVRGAAGTGRVAHPRAESVFAELKIERESSWQYELQQVKYANRRLQEQVAALEASIRGAEEGQQHSHSLPGVGSQVQQAQQAQQHQQQQHQQVSMAMQVQAHGHGQAAMQQMPAHHGQYTLSHPIYAPSAHSQAHQQPHPHLQSQSHYRFVSQMPHEQQVAYGSERYLSHPQLNSNMAAPGWTASANTSYAQYSDPAQALQHQHQQQAAQMNPLKRTWHSIDNAPT